MDPIGFGLFVVNSLSHKYEYYDCFNKDTIDASVAAMDKTITLNLGSLYKKYYGEFLTNEKIFYINKYLHRLFINELYCFIQTQSMYYPHVVITFAINDFFSIFKLSEDDIYKDSIIRDYRRKKQEYSYLE